ncbi:MAG: hypothetical protein JO057_29560, partial [Chloroflexi bacterium]|nr:hypothetical protein [Chloroflexota bacterium]
LVGAWIVQRFDRRGIVQLVTGAAALGVVALLMAPAVWAAMPALGEGGGMLPSAVGPRGGANFGPGRGGPPAPGVRGGPGGFAGRGTQAPGSGAGAAGNQGGAGADGAGPGGAPGGPAAGGGFGGPGGFGFGRGGGANEQELIDYLEANQGSSKFLVATSNSNSAAPIVLATGKPVMSLGGFLGSDPILSPQAFAALVQQGEVRFVLAGGRGFGGFGGDGGVMSWVQQNCTAVDSGQLYDCAG